MFTFPITFNNFSQKFVACVRRNYKRLCLDPLIGRAFPQNFTTAYRRGANIGNMVTNTKIQKDEENIIKGTFRCNRKGCKTCDWTNQDHYLCGPGGYVTPRDKFSCISTHVIYMITCERCNNAYVGETSKMLADRMNGHRYDINKRLRNPASKPNSKVAEHFSENNHSLKDFKVAVVKQVFNQDKRLGEEQRIIQIVGGYRVEGMNTDFYHLRSSR